MQRTGMTPMNQRFPLFTHDPNNSGLIKPVIVHKNIDDQGKYVESELSEAADTTLVDQAMELVKSFLEVRRQPDGRVCRRPVPAVVIFIAFLY